ncbi:MAG: hypothetical protein IJA78_01395 [Clostridia bacterium]|nr:hypothetical protein [Clostridia bacterium]
MAQKKKPQSPDIADVSVAPEVSTTPEKAPAPKRTSTKKSTSAANKQTDAAKSDAAPVKEIKPVQEQTATAALPPPTQALPVQSDGTAVAPAVPPIHFAEGERRRFWSRVLVLLITAAVLAASVLIFLYRPAAYSERTRSVQFFYDEAENTTVVAVNSTERARVTGKLAEACYDRTGRVCAALIQDTLYVIKGNEVEPIVSSVADFTLASDGTVLAYRTADTALYYCAIGKKDGVAKITPKTPQDAAYVLSPDGKELFYTYLHGEQMRVDVHSRSGNKPELKYTEDLWPLAVSNDSDYLYYVDADGFIWVYNGKKKDSYITKCGTWPRSGGIAFNADFSEILFHDEGGMKLYRKGERVQFASLSAEQSLTLLPNQRVHVREVGAAQQYMMRSFLQNYYLKNAASGKRMMVYMNRKGELAEVSFVDAEATVTVTDKSVFFLLTDENESEQHTSLYTVPTGETEKERLCWDVTSYCANVDGSRVLYADYHSTLFALRVGKVAEPISDAVLPETLAVSADDVFCYYRTDGELYYSDNGEAPRKAADGVLGFYTDANTVYYLKDMGDGTGTVYANHRNKRTDTELFRGFPLT